MIVSPFDAHDDYNATGLPQGLWKIYCSGGKPRSLTHLYNTLDYVRSRDLPASLLGAILANQTLLIKHAWMSGAFQFSMFAGNEPATANSTSNHPPVPANDHWLPEFNGFMTHIGPGRNSVQN
jgi:hypothetical protein